MKENLEPYLQATIEASNRSRYVIYIITFVSMIIFGGYWNSKEFSWFKTADDVNHCIYLYVNLAETVYDKICEANKTNPKGVNPEEQKPNNTTDLAFRQELINQKFREIYPRKFAKCKQYIDINIESGNYSFNPHVLKIEKNIIEEKTIYHRQNYMNNVGTISAHFFHENFHINDLPIFSGASFSILLSVLVFSYRRERRNLKNFFALSKEQSQSKESYRILAMHQVLTITPSLDYPKKLEAVERIAKFVPTFLFLIPFILEILIMFETFATYQSVLRYNNTATVINISFGLLFAGIIGMLTIFSFVISMQINQLWEETANEIKSKETV